VEDILKGVMGALEWTEASGPAFEIVNLGESRTVRLDRLIELIAAAVGVEPRIEMLPPQPGDVRQTYADISKARSIFGYDPQVSIEDGIVDFVNWYRSRNGNQSAPTA
jgi:UDP-glucuronate 4-epimerase